MSHSPFPWRTHPQAPHSVFDADGKKIAVTTGHNGADNAALIAAIPELIAALASAEEYISVDTDMPAADAILAQIRAVLQRVTT